jgi:hypothetical protein
MAIKRWVGFAAALVILGGALYLVGRRGSSDVSGPGGDAVEPRAESAGQVPDGVSDLSSPLPSAGPASDGEAGADSPTSDSSSAPLEFPTLEKVRAETADNPHATPPSLIQFARDLAPRMEEALSTQDPRVVRRMVFALKACALSDSKNALPQVQAMCISNWKRVVEAREKEVPGLSDEWKRSENLLPQEARRLIDASNAMLKPGGE